MSGRLASRDASRRGGRSVRSAHVFEDVYGEPPRRTSPAVERAMRAAESDLRESDQARDKKALLGVLFGSAAPYAEQAVTFLATPRGRQVLGVSATAAASYFLPKVL